MDFVCPRPGALTTVVRQTCPENFGQIQRIIFQRSGYVFDDQADPVTDIKLLASWTPLFAANGNTKVVSTPYVENFIIPVAEPITTGGGDNTTVDGIEIIEGAGPITATGTFSGVPSYIIRQLKKLMGEAINPGDLVCYFLNQYGKIIASDTVPSDVAPFTPSGKYTGFPLTSLFIPNPGNQGLNTRDQSNFRFSLVEGWRDAAVIITPGFNVKTQLWPA